MWNSSSSQTLDETQRQSKQASFDKIWWFLFAIGAVVFLASLPVKDVGLEGPQEARVDVGYETPIAAEHQGEIELQGAENEGAVRGSRAVGEA